jgi:DNA-binding PadR family transcriptional regulator
MDRGRSEPGPNTPRLALWPESPDEVPDTRCRFEVSPPRHFLYPAILLLVAEQPRHGYALVDGLVGFGLGTVDRASVYRALAELERDDLVESFDEPPTAGTVRHVYELTASGRQALQAWMSTIALEHGSLDLMLRRYWYCAASWPSLEGAGMQGGSRVVVPRSERFSVASDRSHLVVETRSSVGPIAFATASLSGDVMAAVGDGLLLVTPSPSASLRVQMSDLTSGNALYDSELFRRADARRYPLVTLELGSTAQIGEGNTYQLAGVVTLHGVTRTVEGQVLVTVQEHRAGKGSRALTAEGLRPPDRTLTVEGEQIFDIRGFGMTLPDMPLLKLYPDVRLHLHLEADSLASAPAA